MINIKEIREFGIKTVYIPLNSKKYKIIKDFKNMKLIIRHISDRKIK